MFPEAMPISGKRLGYRKDLPVLYILIGLPLVISAEQIGICLFHPENPVQYQWTILSPIEDHISRFQLPAISCRDLHPAIAFL